MNKYSNANDCYELSKILLRELNGNINFLTDRYIDVPSGKYISEYRNNRLGFSNVPNFSYKYAKDGFLYVYISSHYSTVSFGEKLAALSDFYGVIKDEFGEPSVFYTKDTDDYQELCLCWLLTDNIDEKERIVEQIRTNDFFDDKPKISNLIILDENQDKNEYELPNELLDLIDDEFLKHKTGYSNSLSKTKNN